MLIIVIIASIQFSRVDAVELSLWLEFSHLVSMYYCSCCYLLYPWLAVVVVFVLDGTSRKETKGKRGGAIFVDAQRISSK